MTSRRLENRAYLLDTLEAGLLTIFVIGFAEGGTVCSRSVIGQPQLMKAMLK